MSFLARSCDSSQLRTTLTYVTDHVKAYYYAITIRAAIF